ncbi:MAG TPA: ribonuclease R [Pirellulales bacterium]|nr:ribonuclease R [Pirellulales bacterium]
MSDADQDLVNELLSFVSRPKYRPAKPRQLAKKLNVPEYRLPEFKRIVKDLVKKGRLTYADKHRILPPAGAGQKPHKRQPTEGHITGIFRRNQAGFGFVRPAGTLPGQGREQDIYVAAQDTADAASGDVVLLRLLKGADRERGPRGVITEIIERETHQFVGLYFERAGTGWVRVDGGLFARPIAVGDPGAKNAQPDDKVVFEMVRFPTHTHEGEGVIVEVLGGRGEPGVDTLSILREYNLPEAFTDDVLEAARQEADRFDEANLAGRLDLTAETIITIDPVDARDFDDAISLRREANGHWTLGVHIADVSHFVRPGTPIDRAAYERGTSVYLPDRVVPMLPEIISNGLASLQPNRVRYTKTALLEFTAEGVPVASEFHTAAIQSKRRFTYEEIDEYLSDREKWRSRLTPEVHSLIARMHELAMILRARRLARGALELSMDEVKVDLDRHGRVVGAHKVVNTESHQVIEEFMLAANEAVARRLHQAEWLFLRRVHHSPDPRKLQALTEFVAALGFQTESLQSRFELQKILRDVLGQPERQAVNYALLRSLQRAVYSPEEEGHFALASDCYCHFTSPIRRYPDLTIHRLLELLLKGGKPRQDFSQLAVLGEHCSEREQRAEEAERELTKVKLLNYLSERIGQELNAVITGVESFGFFAQGVELPAEGLVHLTSLTDDSYQYDRRSHTLSGRREDNQFRLGDRVRVVVARVDVDRRELDFRLVERRGRANGEAGEEREPFTRRPTADFDVGRGEAEQPGQHRRAGKKEKQGKKRGKKRFRS